MRIEDYSVTVKTNGFCHVVDLTNEIQNRVTESKLWSGQVLVFVVGATAGIARRQRIFPCQGVSAETITNGSADQRKDSFGNLATGSTDRF